MRTEPVSGNAVLRDWAASGNGTCKCERIAHQVTALGTTVVVEANSALVPMPAWPRRSCEVEGRCAEAGGCDTKLSCLRHGPGCLGPLFDRSLFVHVGSASAVKALLAAGAEMMAPACSSSARPGTGSGCNGSPYPHAGGCGAQDGDGGELAPLRSMRGGHVLDHRRDLRRLPRPPARRGRSVAGVARAPAGAASSLVAPGPGADVGGTSPVPGQTWEG